MRSAITLRSIHASEPHSLHGAARQYDELKQFLEGLPQRYLQTRLPEQIRNHFQMR